MIIWIRRFIVYISANIIINNLHITIVIVIVITVINIILIKSDFIIYLINIIINIIINSDIS